MRFLGIGSSSSMDLQVSSSLLVIVRAVLSSKTGKTGASLVERLEREQHRKSTRNKLCKVGKTELEFN